ncbi:hypothetical protein CLOM_g14691 [Closterium sp. NIES-68]|nr:hypothetical protein CLOM_g14691 [Closterium sp. NIES-68]GJP74932.1 hypothetical protein CLOP_g5448 [Closterium sp. NIES-67]
MARDADRLAASAAASESCTSSADFADLPAPSFIVAASAPSDSRDNATSRHLSTATDSAHEAEISHLPESSDRDSGPTCAAAVLPDESGPLDALSELDSCDLISGPHSAHRQPRQPRKRGDDGKLLMSWRAPDWTLPPLTADLNLSPVEPLERLESRTQCPGCGKSQHYLCFNCLRAFTPPSVTPRLALPFHAHIVFHRTERPSMSTGVHAAVLAPAHVTLHRWADIEAGGLPRFDPADTVVLFPSGDAREVGDMGAEERRRVKRVVLLESKWKGAPALLSLRQLSSLPHIRLPGCIRSAFWRYHTRGVAPDAVSTVEALMWLCRCWHARAGEGSSVAERHGGTMGQRETDGEGEKDRERDGAGDITKGAMHGGVGGRVERGAAGTVKRVTNGNAMAGCAELTASGASIESSTCLVGSSSSLHTDASPCTVAVNGASSGSGHGHAAACAASSGSAAAVCGVGVGDGAVERRPSDCHCFDDLLWFFAHFHHRIAQDA